LANPSRGRIITTTLISASSAPASINAREVWPKMFMCSLLTNARSACNGIRASLLSTYLWCGLVVALDTGARELGSRPMHRCLRRVHEPAHTRYPKGLSIFAQKKCRRISAQALITLVDCLRCDQDVGRYSALP